MILFFLATLVASQPIKRGGCSNDYLAAVSEVVDTITGIFEGFATFFHPVSEGGPLGKLFTAFMSCDIPSPSLTRLYAFKALAALVKMTIATLWHW